MKSNVPQCWQYLQIATETAINLPLNKLNSNKPKSRITAAEATVAQKLHQGTIRQKGCNLLPGSFFGSFLDKQKRTILLKELTNKLNTLYLFFCLDAIGNRNLRLRKKIKDK